MEWGWARGLGDWGDGAGRLGDWRAGGAVGLGGWGAGGLRAGGLEGWGAGGLRAGGLGQLFIYIKAL